MELARFDADTFLRDYWQKHPLLIRNPWAAWTNPLEPDELAGLACEDGNEARLVRRTPKQWKAEHGPFDESRFGKLGKHPWTLLVQAVDHHVPEVAALIAPFRFVPNWRIDDVMVSYASDGGGVGPHFDQYDVFLIQGLGQRRWQIGSTCDAATELLAHDDLRLLAEFTPTEEWVLEPGDILYVPPGVAHNGVAVGDDCMTYSIGFRAPSRSELIAHWCDHVLAGLDEDDRYGDLDLTAQANPGEIGPQALDRLQAMIAEKLGDQQAFARWFGTYTSARKYPDVDWTPEEPITVEELREQLARDGTLCRNPASRFSFVRSGLLFVDGESFDYGPDITALAESICAQDRLTVTPDLLQSDAAMELLATLFNQGSVAFDQPD
ncbi:cupin domain-containing protein [Novosphingobium sp. G106]|uniref:cupin domain-containing protein n=1 Tax=Novosphingobium sp. G106 TaxID=2849500 RepID=UPI001C2D4BB3|nr:cupin domain-containing protein [Novosphingobium sp. G106]MBV1687025.1 cupin domain-containing protein [Novosphingobium sp. G106]